MQKLLQVIFEKQFQNRYDDRGLGFIILDSDDSTLGEPRVAPPTGALRVITMVSSPSFSKSSWMPRTMVLLAVSPSLQSRSPIFHHNHLAPQPYRHLSRNAPICPRGCPRFAIPNGYLSGCLVYAVSGRTELQASILHGRHLVVVDRQDRGGICT